VEKEVARKLDNLPPSEDEYWDNAEVKLINRSDPARHEHLFSYKSAREIQCGKCGFGLFIGLGDRLKEGHLYHYDQIII
jgi:hypothetical protein